MAVDIKSLRIGSHISINGERVEVESLQGGDMVGYITPDNDWFATESWRFEPISITPALLKEFGFEQDMRFAYGKAFKMERGEMWIGVSAMSKGFWRIEAMDDTYNYGNCIVRYLHEAELFLGLHNIELIQE